MSTPDTTVNDLARDFHETYERLAAGEGWETQKNCRVDFDDLPEANRNLMMAVSIEIYERHVRTLTAENEVLKASKQIVDWVNVEERIAALTTKLSEAEAMLAVKPSAMEYADLKSQLEQSRKCEHDAHTARIAACDARLKAEQHHADDHKDLIARIGILTAENAKYRMAMEYDDALDDAEWQPSHPIFNLAAERDAYAEQIATQTLRITELEQALETAGYDEEHVFKLEAQMEQHQWHRVEEMPDLERRVMFAERMAENDWAYGGDFKAVTVADFVAWADEQGWTHWRYSTPPETSE